MESFSRKQSLHTLSPDANGFIFFMTSHLMLKYLKDDLCKLNLVLNLFSVSLIYIYWLFEVVSVTVFCYYILAMYVVATLI